MNNAINSLGIMNGTSMDGVDFCLAKISLSPSYEFNYKIISEIYIPFTSEEKTMIKNSLNDIGKYDESLDDYLGKYYYMKIKEHFFQHKVDIVSIHGQTISHNSGRYSVQVGSPKYIYQKLNLPVFYNFRKKDIDAGGCGAPLMPFLDWLLFKKMGSNTLALNIGGIANISYLPKNARLNEVIGYDTGPGMSLIDECVNLFWNKDIDLDCTFSSKGMIDEQFLASLLKHKFLSSIPPKSTGRNEFGVNYLNKILDDFNSIDKFDVIRTLVYFSAKTITDCIKKETNGKEFDFYINGGGKHHSLLLNDIFSMLDNYTYKELSNININSDFKESLLMCVLGVARFKKINSNIASVTGANFNVICGEEFNE